MESNSTAGPSSVAIPADVELEDKIVFGLTTRQLLILGVAALGLYGVFTLTRDVLPLWAFAAVGALGSAVAIALALGRRDGISFDQWVLAAWTYRARTHPDPRPVPGLVGLRRPLTRPRLAARSVAEAWQLGVIDLGAAGMGAVAVASTVSFALRTPAEQEALVATFARYLHSLTAPVQLLIRAQPLDLSAQIQALDQAAGQLHPPALAAAASEHADYLHELGSTHKLLCRQIVIIVREPPPPGPRRTGAALIKADRAAITRLSRRLTEAADLLAPAGITLTILDADSARALLRSACQPLQPIPSGEAQDPNSDEPDEVVLDHDRSAESEQVDDAAADQPDEHTTTDWARHTPHHWDDNADPNTAPDDAQDGDAEWDSDWDSDDGDADDGDSGGFDDPPDWPGEHADNPRPRLERADHARRYGTNEVSRPGGHASERRQNPGAWRW